MTTPHEPDPTTVIPTPATPGTPPAGGPVSGTGTAETGADAPRWTPTEARPVTPEDASPPTPVTPTTEVASGVGSVPTTPVVVAARRRPSGAFLNALLAIALAVAVGGVAFAIGRSTAPASAAAANGGFVANGAAPGGGTGQFGGPRGSFTPGQGGPAFGGRGVFGAGGLSIDGTVTAVEGDHLTIKTANGNEVTVTLDDETTYHTATTATAGDVTVGATVDVHVDAGGRVSTNGNGNGSGNAGNGNGNGNGNANGAVRQLTAGDVTVRQ